MKKEYQKFLNYLSSHKLKMTKSRELIFKEIFASNRIHLNAEEIYQRLKGRKIKISRATIYRTLNLLVRSGLVSEIRLGENHTHYEPYKPEIGHGHLVCLSCGQVIEFTSRDISFRISQIGRENKFLLDKFSIQIFGYCHKCQIENEE